jgi:hypothetical protein
MGNRKGVNHRRGVKNKFGAQAKENIIAVFTRIGGTAAMAVWAREHRTEFYRIYSQLVPREVKAEIHTITESDLTDAELAAIATGSSLDPAEETAGESETSPVH